MEINSTLPRMLRNQHTQHNSQYYNIWKANHREHQSNALSNVSEQDFGQVLIPTGCGKTRCISAILTEDMIAKSLVSNTGTYIIAAHRLELCSQLLDSLLDLVIQCNLKFDMLFIGSLKYDFTQIKAKYASVNFSVCESEDTSTTKSTDIRRAKDIADSQGRHLIVVSTYHSFNRLDALESIDICTYDEAHVTIGDDFKDNIALVRPKIKRNYFFTATRRVIGDTQGMNNAEVYGPILYEVAPRKMIDAGEIVPPILHMINTVEYGDFANHSMLIRTTISAFNEHKKYIKEHSAAPELLGAKLLVATSGTEEVEELINDVDFKEYCLKNNIKVLSFSSSRTAGYTVDFVRVSRNETRNALKQLTDKSDAILIHVDILTEGIDLPSITGVMSYRNLNKTKLLQTIGRGTRLFGVDRQKLYSGEIKPGEYDKFVKPYCYVIIPEHFWDELEKDVTKDMVTQIMNSYDIPTEEISITDKYLCTPEQELENITKGDQPNRLDNVTQLEHTIKSVLVDINVSNFIVRGKEIDSREDFEKYLNKFVRTNTIRKEI
jgi:superfamily II DNA or RNA helicase